MKQITDLTRTINTGLQEIEILGSTGAVNLGVTEHFKLRQTQSIKAERERELKALSDTGGPSGHQKLQVCDVCGAYLSRLDNDRRLADHFYGKMHLGYAQMRKAFEIMQKEFKGRPAPAREDGGRDEGRDAGYGGGYGDGGWGGRGGSRGRGGFRGGGGYRGGGGFRGGRW